MMISTKLLIEPIKVTMVLGLVLLLKICNKSLTLQEDSGPVLCMLTVGMFSKLHSHSVVIKIQVLEENLV